MKEKLINIGIGVVIGVIVTSICFIVYINVKGIGKKRGFDGPPKMNQSQSFNKDGKTPPEFPNKDGQKNTDDTSKTQKSQQGESNS